MNFYNIYADTCIEDYAVPGPEIKVLEAACFTSEFQYLDRYSVLKVELAPESGLVFPDYLTAGYVPLVSEKFRRILDASGVDNLFYKRVILTFSARGREESYWLALPPRIVCLDEDRSEIAIDDDPYTPAEERSREAMKIVINPTCVGNYQIFRLANVVNRDTIVTEKLYSALVKHGLENVYFEKLEG